MWLKVLHLQVHLERSDEEQPNPETSIEVDRKFGVAQNVWVGFGFVLQM